MIGTTLSHFRVTAKLGEGGMGEVYRATDTKLGREVAIKVLPAEMADSEERLERFRREAQALAALDHPGIVTVYSVEEADGLHFLTMQLVEGEPLDQLIPERGLGDKRILEIGTAVAAALAAAHEKSIVHRDLKPSNIMVTDEGRVKVLDFGLAKIAGQEPDTPLETEMPTALLTREGVVMGTVPYMSPEQVAGRALDVRTDIFSLGVVLYEMAAGQLPFAGQSSAELASAILRDRPEPLAEKRSDLRPDLARVIERCLEKDPEARFATARDLREGLAGIAAGETPADATPTELFSEPLPSVDAAVAPASTGARMVGSGAARAEEGFWVAVLPFRYSGPNADLTALAEGLSEEVVTGLSRFSYLRVIARSSTQRYADEVVDVRSVGEQLGARYVMEGSIRQAGSTLRISAQLVDAVSGAHLWAESYKRTFDPDEIFEVQDEVAPRIVSTVADMNGVLPHSMSELLRQRDVSTLSPYEAVLRGFGYLERIEAREHAEVRAALERAVEEAPDQADAWAMLSMMVAEEFKHDFNLRPEPLDRALEAARRAVAIAPSNHLAYHMLAQAHFFRRELEAFRNAADRAIALNPMDGCTTAFMGILMAYAGDWEHGCALAERAMELNPHHPGWYRFSSYFNAYRQEEYRAALDVALKFNMPSYFYTHAAIAAAYGQLGERQAAQAALKELLAQKPDFAQVARQELAKWHGSGEIVEAWLDGLRKAGLDIPEASESAVPPTEAPPKEAPATASLQARDSGAARADEGFWVAVLPFKYSGTDPDVTALAEGLTEEIVTGLARFSYLRVIARSSTSTYSEGAEDPRIAGKQLGARYVMEGSLRQAGGQLRVAVQLVDVDSGAHLWAETYDRRFDPDQVFALQDELAPRIVSTVADMNGVLPRSMGTALRSRDPQQLSPYEAVLRSFGYLERATPDELAAALSALEVTVEKAPDDADAWAMLAYLSGQDYGQGFGVLSDPLVSGEAAARRAVELGPSNPLAYLSLAELLFFQKELGAFRNAAERAAALNPMDGNSTAFLGEMLIYTGDVERGLELTTRAKQLNPNHPGWYWYADVYIAFRQGDDRGALEILQKVNLPGHWYLHAAKAACLGHLGEGAAAAQSLRKLRDLRPDFATTAPQEMEKWWEPDYVERFVEGLRKAGLDTSAGRGRGERE